MINNCSKKHTKEEPALELGFHRYAADKWEGPFGVIQITSPIIKHLQNFPCPESHAPGTMFHFPVFFCPCLTRAVVASSSTAVTPPGYGVSMEQCPACRAALLQQETHLSWGKAVASAFLSRENTCWVEWASLELFVSPMHFQSNSDCEGICGQWM